MPSLVQRVPLRDAPRHWRSLLALELLAVGALVASMLVTLATPDSRVGAPGRVYESLLVTVVFGLPALTALATGALDGGLLRALGLAALPSLAWTVTVPAGYALRRALGYGLPIADAPLWAISGVFLAFGLVGGAVGFLVGRVGLLLWRRRGA
jgi:hypothetical protein